MIDLATAKKVVIALFFGGQLVPHPKQRIFQLLGYDVVAIGRLKADPEVTALRRDVKAMWNILLRAERAMNGLSAMRGGAVVPTPERIGSQRSAIYNRLERLVVDVIESALERDGIFCVLIHDGFMVPRRIDHQAMEQLVLEKTGFRIRLTETFMQGPGDEVELLAA
ncbi:hypothetical protein PFX98_19165 [Paucibacter sediminis]|uniref:Uncharacterized protein n=1 Tax=Paucibacter sediminis TaxID=3019553 RepID=A0AA95NC66_9BURK|nr:hypothetical protein [Paucibacter sp. S2-9]WIT11008.1 hypothetical protein PFX98_19165 [Paucibacter sp. S2-9]